MKKTLFILTLVLLVVASMATSSFAGGRHITFSGAHQASASDSTGPWWFGPFEVGECFSDSGNWIPFLCAVGNSVLGTNVDSIAIFLGNNGTVNPATTFGTGTGIVGLDLLTEIVGVPGRIVLATDGTAVCGTSVINPTVPNGYSIHTKGYRYAWVRISHIYASGLTYDNYTYFNGGCVKWAGWSADEGK